MPDRSTRRSVLGAVPYARRLRVLTALVGVVGCGALLVTTAGATDTAWVTEAGIAAGVVDSEIAEDLPGNDCDETIQ